MREDLKMLSTHPLVKVGEVRRVWRVVVDGEESSHGPVMVYGMCLGREVCQIVRTRAPNDLEVSHLGSVLDPVVLHQDGLALLDFVGNTQNDVTCGFVIVGHRGWLLRVSEVKESLTVDLCTLTIQIHGGV